MDIAELLAFSNKNNASDLHISAGLPPMIRVDGDVKRINLPKIVVQQRFLERFLQLCLVWKILAPLKFLVSYVKNQEA